MDGNASDAGLEPLIPRHGGYRRLKSFRVAQLVYDVTVRFCDRYVGRRGRMRDQMIQEDFLRHRGLARWERDDPRLQGLIDLRPESAEQVAGWVGQLYRFQTRRRRERG